MTGKRDKTRDDIIAELLLKVNVPEFHSPRNGHHYHGLPHIIHIVGSDDDFRCCICRDTKRIGVLAKYRKPQTNRMAWFICDGCITHAHSGR